MRLMADTTITVGGDTRLLVRQIEQALSKNYKLANIDFQKGGQPLGKIKGQLGEFEKSLEASNARVVAFGASAGAIYLLQDAFKGLVNSTVQVEKTLADINVIFNRSEKELKSFGDSLFQIANDTSQSFDTTAKAALEFSRQGLGLEQTLKRTSDALVLARISGLSAADSVEALTAAVNSFSDAGLTTAQIVNKLAAVDARYAVSSADLAEAIKRVGSSASEAGVSLDQLIALVTSAQQTTARGGAVIGNSFKTIFTRLQRPKAIDELEEIGIQTRNVAGDTLPLIQILSQLASTYDSLSSAQKSQTAELVGGVYQINVLKAVLSDLSKTYDSTFVGALKASSSATNEAEKRVASLTETLDSQINRVTNNLKRAGSVVGELTIAPALQNVLSAANAVLEDFALSKKPESYGEKVAYNFFKGLGNFLGGPGLIIGLTGVFQIFKRLSFFIADASKTILGLSQSASQQANLQTQISQTLQKNPALYQQATTAAEGLSLAAKSYLNILRSINAELERQRAIGGAVSQMPVQTAVAGMAGRRNAPSTRRRRASGYIPNFYDPVLAQEEKDARRKNAINPKAYYTKAVIGGVSQTVAVNDQEQIIHKFAGGRDTAIIPDYMPLSKVSRNASGGYVPNYAFPKYDDPQKQWVKVKITGAERRMFYETLTSKDFKEIFGASGIYDQNDYFRVFSKESYRTNEFSKAGGSMYVNPRFMGKMIKYFDDLPNYPESVEGLAPNVKTGEFADRLVKAKSDWRNQQKIRRGLARFGRMSSGYVPNYAANPIGLSELRNIIQSKQFQSITYTKANGQTSQYNAAQWRVRRDKLVGGAPPAGYKNWTEFDAASNSVVLHTVKSGEADAKFRRFTLSNIKQVRANGQTYDINSSLMSSGYIPNYAKRYSASRVGRGSLADFYDLNKNFQGVNIGKKVFKPQMGSEMLKHVITKEFIAARELQNLEEAKKINPIWKSPKLIGTLERSLQRKAIGKESMRGFITQEDLINSLGNELEKNNLRSLFKETNTALYDQINSIGKFEVRDLHTANVMVNPQAQNIFTNIAKSKNFPKRQQKFLFNSNSSSKIQLLMNRMAKKGARLSVVDPGEFALKDRSLEKEYDEVMKYGKSEGYIPNFAGLSDAINREKMMTGLPASQIMTHFDKNGNPIAVTNKKHEPNGLRDVRSKGYVPNFAKKEPAFNPLGNAQELLKSKYPIAGENIPAPMYSEIEKAKQLLADEDAKKAKKLRIEQNKKARAERSKKFFESKRIERQNARAIKAAQKAASEQYGQTQARSKTVSALAASEYQRAYSPTSSQLRLIRAGQVPAINLPTPQTSPTIQRPVKTELKSPVSQALIRKSFEPISVPPPSKSSKGLEILPRKEFRMSQESLLPFSARPKPNISIPARTTLQLPVNQGFTNKKPFTPISISPPANKGSLSIQTPKIIYPIREDRKEMIANRSSAKSIIRQLRKLEKEGQRPISSTYKAYGAQETQRLLAKLNAPISNVPQTAASARGGLPVGGTFGPAMTGVPSAKMQLGSFGASIGLSLAFSQLPLIADLLGVQGIYEDENKTQLSRKGSTISQVGMAGSFASAFLNPAVLQSLASIPRGAVTRGRAGLESIGSKIGGGEGLFKKGFLNASSLGPSNPYAAKAGMNKSMIESLTRQQSLLSKFSKAGKAIPFVGTGLTLAMGGLQGYQASQSGASFLESLVLGGLPTAGMLLGGAIGGIAGGPLGGVAGSAAGSYLGSSLSKTLISEQRLKQLEENRNTQIDLQEKSRRYKGSAATMLGLSAESIKRIPLEKTGAETDREYAQKIKASSDDYLNLRKQQAAQIIEDIGGIQAATRLLNESGGNIDKFSKTISKAYVNLGKSEAGGVFTDTTATAAAEASKQADIVAKAIKKFEGIKSLSPLLTDLRGKFDILTAKTSLYLAALDSLQEKERKRGETLIKNFGGGLEGYLDPKKNLDPLDKIQKSLQFLNDPRFARNTVERGRVAYGLLQSTTELGITLPPEQEKRLSAIFSQGFQDSLNRMTGMVQLSGKQVKNDFGLSRGVDLSRMAMVRRGKAAGGLTAAEQLFSGDETAAKIGIRNPLELQVRNLTQQQVEELRSRGRELNSEIFSKIESVLAAVQEGRLEESKARELLEKASRISFGAAFGADDKTIIADLKKLIDSLDIKTRNEAEKLNTFKVESTVSGNIEVGLSEQALKYLTFAENFQMANNTDKKNSNGTVLPRDRGNR